MGFSLMNYGRVSYRDAISTDPSDRVIFGYELLSQPDESLETRIPGIRKKNGAIITVASSDDIVLLTDPLPSDYLNWLNSHNFGTENIFLLDKKGNKTIPELATNNPSLNDYLSRFSGDRIYVPRYSGQNEVAAANSIDARLFGSDADTVMSFYDKSSFKSICKAHDIPVLDGEIVDLESENSANAIKKYFESTGFAVGKSLSASSGLDIYHLRPFDLEKQINEMRDAGLKEILVETKIDPVYEMNVNFSVGLDDEISFIGISNQIIENNAHRGNYFPFFSSNIKSALDLTYSIGEIMRDSGYNGHYGVDILEDASGDLFVLENNSRMNGSTPACDLVSKLSSRHGSIPSFIYRQIKQGNPMSFSELQKSTSEFLYDGSSQFSFFPLNMGLVEETGSLSVLATGESYDHAKHILKKSLDSIGLSKIVTYS